MQLCHFLLNLASRGIVGKLRTVKDDKAPFFGNAFQVVNDTIYRDIEWLAKVVLAQFIEEFDKGKVLDMVAKGCQIVHVFNPMLQMIFGSR